MWALDASKEVTFVDDVAVFAVVLGVLCVVVGGAYVAIAVAGAATRQRERKTADFLGTVRPPVRHRRCPIGRRGDTLFRFGVRRD